MLSVYKNFSIKMNKKLIFMIGILLLLAVAGCQGGKKDQSPISDVDIRKGTDGIIMEFLPNAPPENVFEGDESNPSEFPISLRIKNAGATDIGGSIEKNKETLEIEGGIIALGFEKAYVGIVPAGEEKQEFGIKGKSIYNPFGDEDFITIEGEAKKIGVQSEKHPSTIFATACYPYSTTLGTSVCIDPEIIPQEQGQQKACQVRDLVFSEGQGGPVSVIKVETRILPQADDKVKPHFLIHIKNAGNGQIVNASNFDKACTSGGIDYKEFFNTVIVSASLSGMPLKCNGKEILGDPTRVVVTLRKGSGFALAKSEDMIRCTLEEDLDGDGNPDDFNNDGKQDIEFINSGADAYVSSLKVELEYGYTFTISKNIIIEKILTH